MTEYEIDEILEKIEVIYIDGNPLNDPKPSDYSFATEELDLDSGRGLDGVMQRNVLKHHPRRLNLVFNYLNGEQMAKLLQIVDKSILFVNAWEPKYNALSETMTMMHGTPEPKVNHWTWDYEKNKPTPIYEPLTIQLVEY